MDKDAIYRLKRGAALPAQDGIDRTEAKPMSKRYAVFESAPFGTVRCAGAFNALSDGEALRRAREVLPNGPGELRESGRIVCRFGRAEQFLLGS